MIENCALKVLHVASGDLWAGAEVQLYTLAKTLHTKTRANISVVLLNHGRLEQELIKAGIKVIVIDESKLNGFRILNSLVQAIRLLKPDVIHTHRLKENIIGSLAAWLADRIPCLRTVHGAPEHRPSWRQLPERILFFIDRQCGRFLQKKIIAVSEELGKILAADYPSEKIYVIENGIDLDAIRLAQSTHRISRHAAGKQFRAGFAGRLVPVKRVDILLEAARYFVDARLEQAISFHIFGDGPLREKLERLNQSHNTESIVHFEGHCDDMLTQLQELDAIIMTSDHEGLPMILLEAMALQIPVISHAVGGIPRLLDHGTCGILVNGHEPMDYVRAITDLATKPGKRTDLTSNALKRVTERYSADENAKAYCAAYIQCVPQHDSSEGHPMD
jgi:glycosyltransferase involved in cell wall biosynthesis